MRAGVVTLAALATLSGCGDETAAPRDQWRVVVSTNAPVPQFGDRVLVEVLQADHTPCVGCRRELVAPNERWPLSFGVVPGGAVAVRVRLYRAALVSSNGPSSDRIVDSIVELPRASDGVAEISVHLDMRCFGVPAQPETWRTCDPETGALVPVATAQAAGPLVVDTWEPAQPVGCKDEPPAGMVCVPGGVFLLGSPTAVPGGDLDPLPEQLVRVKPFFMDIDEVTVGEARPHLGNPPPDTAGNLFADTCTYTTEDVGNEAMPLNCVPFEAAVAICQNREMRLPSEAEWEWAAGNGAAETVFPWGDGGDPCALALVGLGRPAQSAMFNESDACRGADGVPGLRVGGSEGDVSVLGLRNLGGSVAEWTADTFLPYSAPDCWGYAATLHEGSACTATSPTGRRVARGGAWYGVPYEATVARRSSRKPVDITEDPSVGFRCVQDAVPAP